MSTKPTVLPRWADVSGDIVEPTSGKKDVGWVKRERPPAQYFNWLLNTIYLWTQYLSDGALSGDHSIAGNLSVTGLYKRPDRLHTLSLISGYQNSGTNANKDTSSGITNGRVSFTTPVTGNDWIVPVIGLQEGTRIKAVKLRVNENLTGGNGQVTVELRKSNATSSVLASGSTGGSGAQTVTATLGTPETIAADVGDQGQYYVRILVDGDTGVCILHDVALVTDCV